MFLAAPSTTMMERVHARLLARWRLMEHTVIMAVLFHSLFHREKQAAGSIHTQRKRIIQGVDTRTQLGTRLGAVTAGSLEVTLVSVCSFPSQKSTPWWSDHDSYLFPFTRFHPPICLGFFPQYLNQSLTDIVPIYLLILFLLMLGCKLHGTRAFSV